MKKLVVLLADGFEELEAICPIDILRRANIDVRLVSTKENSLDLTGAHNIRLRADIGIENLITQINKGSLPDALICPGGMPGSLNLAKNDRVKQVLKAMAKENRLIAAICAAPVVTLAPLGLLDKKTFTCYPGMEKPESFKTYAPDAQPKAYLPEAFVQDGNILTSRGAGTAADFSFKLVELLLDKKTALEVKQNMLF